MAPRKPIAEKPADGPHASRLRFCIDAQHERSKIHVEHFAPQRFKTGKHSVHIASARMERPFPNSPRECLRVDLVVTDASGNRVPDNGPHYIDGPRLCVRDGDAIKEDPAAALKAWAEHHLTALGIK